MSKTNPDDTDDMTTAGGAGSELPADLKVSRSDDGQYLFIHAGECLLAIYGAMGADPEVVQLADGRRYAVEDLLDMMAPA
ncbi:MAG: hypothetical protein K9J42_08120 [Sulfuritalea sp.]|nr:hypothetical protein [Sulfuritalea sp.]